jgi:putative membrane protein
MSSDTTTLAVSRTMMAHDRTLMAWVRTSTSMISFGFTIYKFFQYLHDQNPLSDAHRLFGPRAIALILIGIGLAGLALATLDYRQQMARLRQQFPSAGPHRGSVTLAVATMVAGLGVFGFVLVLLRQ